MSAMRSALAERIANHAATRTTQLYDRQIPVSRTITSSLSPRAALGYALDLSRRGREPGSSPPEGRDRWTIELLAGEMVRLTDHESISGETVRRRLAENELKPWREKMWCVPKIDGAYVARMEDVLDLYAAPPDPARPVVCLDESLVQLIGQVREPIPAAPGQVARVDYEYCRNGTVNLFVAVDAHRSWRKVSVTERRTARDYAERLRELVDVDDPDAACIRVVQDNLSTHTPGPHAGLAL